MADSQPIIYQAPKAKGKLDSKDINQRLSRLINTPQYLLGYNNFIHANREKMVKKEHMVVKIKEKVYLVTNPYEVNINDYDDDIGAKSKNYFNADIEDRSFYPIWEILMRFDLVDINSKSFVSAHVAGGTEGPVQAVVHYRDQFAKKNSKSDKHVLLQVKSGREHVMGMDQKFLKDKRISAGKSAQADLVVADGGGNWLSLTTEEQEGYQLILDQIITAARSLKNGGSFVLKLYECFTLVTVKYVYLLQHMFDSVQMIKPLMSRGFVAERYLVCQGFKKDKKLDGLLSALEGLQNIPDGWYRVELFQGLEIPSNLMTWVQASNEELIRHFLISMNRLVKYVKGEIYRGDEYVLFRREQIAATNKWTETFFPAPNKLSEKLTQLKSSNTMLVKQSNDAAIDLGERMAAVRS